MVVREKEVFVLGLDDVALTFTELVKVPSSRGRTIRLSVADAPLGRSPKFQVSTPGEGVVIPCETRKARTDTEFGRKSPTTTLEAVEGPRLRTATVYVRLLRTNTKSGAHSEIANPGELGNTLNTEASLILF